MKDHQLFESKLGGKCLVDSLMDVFKSLSHYKAYIIQLTETITLSDYHQLKENAYKICFKKLVICLVLEKPDVSLVLITTQLAKNLPWLEPQYLVQAISTLRT
jgi:hypothetical protein